MTLVEGMRHLYFELNDSSQLTEAPGPGVRFIVFVRLTRLFCSIIAGELLPLKALFLVRTRSKPNDRCYRIHTYCIHANMQ
jgi:hypothetical protein